MRLARFHQLSKSRRAPTRSTTRATSCWTTLPVRHLLFPKTDFCFSYTDTKVGLPAIHCTAPQSVPSHLEVKVPLVVIVWPPPVMVAFPEPLTFSGLSASTLIAPLTLVSALSHMNLTSALLLVEVTMVRVQSFCSSLNGAFSSCSLVMQLLEVLVLVLVFSAEFAFILASILPRCSVVSLARTSAGMR